jgi:hypothetical protein
VALPAGCTGSSDGGGGSALTAGPAGVGALADVLSPSATSGTGPGTGASTSSSTAGLPAATVTRTAAAGELTFFTTPTKNIGCSMDEATVRCDIDQHQWPTPSRPRSCTLDYGQGIVLGTDVAHFVCAGDTEINPNAPILAYNSAARAGNLVCVSTQASMTCRNLATGHGFILSKEDHTMS